MKIKSVSYKRGIKLNSPVPRKLESIPSVAIEAPDLLYVPTRQMKGSSPSVVVAKGDKVKKGTRIAVTGDAIIVSPVSGVVEAVEFMPSVFGGMNQVVKIQNDHNETAESYPKFDLAKSTKAELLDALRSVSIVDYDGEPILKKFAEVTTEEKTVIVNLASDEPYQYTNLALIKEKLEDCAEAVQLVARLTTAKEIVFAVNKKERHLFDEFLDKANEQLFDVRASVIAVPPIYPIGDELELVRAYKKKRFKSTEDSRASGLVAFDLFTLYAIKKLLIDGEPVDSRPISIIEKFKKIKTTVSWVKIGMSLSDVVSAVMVKGVGSIRKLVAGGLMRGMAQGSDLAGVTQSLKSIVLIKDKMVDEPTELPCITCGKCVKACPAKLVPYEIDHATLNKDYNEAMKLGAKSCTKCGCCSFECPSKRYLAQRISYAKEIIINKGFKDEK